MSEVNLNPIPLILVSGATAFICISVASALIGGNERKPMGSRQTPTEQVKTEVVKEVMKELDPVDSLYFDTSVARFSAYGGDVPHAKHWLGENAALGELHRAVRLGLIEPSKAGEIEKELKEAIRLLGERKLEEARRKIEELQAKTGEIAYSAILHTFKERGVDPPQLLDSRFELLREKKRAEWEAKGYPPGLIEKALLWANEWSRGIARRFIREPALAARVAESIYPEALELSEKYIQAFAKS